MWAAPQRIVRVGERLLDSTGRTVSSVKLDGGRGVVRRGLVAAGAD